jgi:4-hydroxybenzoate polyprenyltransferase
MGGCTSGHRGTHHRRGTEAFVPHARSTSAAHVGALVGAAHAGPTLAVTVVTGVLAASADLTAGRAVLVVAAVLTGQLSVGWSNDLLDADRDRSVHRTDKPLATGAVGAGTVRTACIVALTLTVPLSLACGALAGAIHLLFVACGWAYNLRLKSTVWSWLPYAVAFGILPVFVTAAQSPPAWPPAWGPAVGALLGVGAHLVNALPDLADDAATGVRGLPHRIGARWTAPLATLALASASVVIGAAVPARNRAVTWLFAAVVVVLSVTALLGRGRTPFRAAVAIALVDVAMLAGAR